MEEAATVTTTEGTFCLQQISVAESSEDDYQYEEVPADDEFSLQDGDEDLAKALYTIQEQAVDAQIMHRPQFLSESTQTSFETSWNSKVVT